jgi:hypothetical protein
MMADYILILGLQFVFWLYHNALILDVYLVLEGGFGEWNDLRGISIRRSTLTALESGFARRQICRP